MQSTSDASRRLWALCNVLRDDGITYHEYIAEITLIIFFRLANSMGVESQIPERYRWSTIRLTPTEDLLETYKHALADLSQSENPTIASIFQGSITHLRTNQSLARLVDGIDAIEWQKIAPNSVGDIYESLIVRNAQESRYGAGQYFTPRAIIEAMIEVIKPKSTELVFDPAAGTAGFLVAAGQYSIEHGGTQCRLVGSELVPEVHRLAQMNIYLHNLDSKLTQEDSLAQNPALREYDVCLTNPPFGIKGDLTASRYSSLPIATNNKQLAFLQHVYLGLRDRGRAAVVVPDNVLFETGAAAAVRTDLLDHFDLHTILRLPTGIFYASGVRTSVLFFARTLPTSQIWIYDLRQEGGFTKKRPLELNSLYHFISSYGSDPFGGEERQESELFTAYDRQAIRRVDDRLDIGQSYGHDVESGSPTAKLQLIADELDNASAALRGLQDLLKRVDQVE